MYIYLFDAVPFSVVIQGNPPLCPCPTVLHPLADVCVCLRGSDVIRCVAIFSTYILVTCMLFLGKGHSL